MEKKEAGEKSSRKEKSKQPIELLHPIGLGAFYSKIHSLVRRKLWLKVLVGLFFGIIVGILLGPSVGILEPERALIIGEWLSLPGIIFLRIIQMIVIPLIFASIIIGIAGMRTMERLRKTGLIVVVYFIFTTLIAILIGLMLAFLIKPGNYINKDIIGNVIDPSNVTKAGFQQSAFPSVRDIPSFIGRLLPTNLLGSMVNNHMLSVVIFAIIFGVALVSISPKRSRPLLSFLSSIQKVCMVIVKWAMWLAPLAVFGMIAKLAIQFGSATLLSLGVYVITVIIGLSLLMIFYFGIVFLSSGRTPIEFIKSVKDAQLLAFSTSSSAAVMPLSMKISEENLKVKPGISQFIIPIGATINMDGTALYQVIATIFLAQIFGINLGLTTLIFLIIMIIGSSIGTPSTPGVGIAILAVILSNIGVPTIGLALILGVDRILDMLRTATNVTGDLTASIFINRIVR